jgi:hypothetical protein
MFFLLTLTDLITVLFGDIVPDIKLKRMECVQCLIGVANGRVVKGKPEGRRRMGRPWLRWLEDVERSLREMQVKRWRQKAVDREE